MTRFEFGQNWRRFLERLDEERIARAQRSLVELLPGSGDLRGLRFLDIGSGSGLFSLAARRLGAVVHSFDADPDSVACTAELRRRYRPDDPSWTVERGSVLDRRYVEGLGDFDVVYAWGVLHHTGDLWRALENALLPVEAGALLCLAIYNDQGAASRRWRSVKRWFNRSPAPIRFLLVCSVGAFFLVRKGVHRVRTPRARREPGVGGRSAERGMSRWHDLVDWVGGYPFEVASPDAVVRFHEERGFQLERLRTVGANHGCNEFVFRRPAGESPSDPPRRG